MKDILDLSGKIALVTGAGQGVGRQIALHFAEYNAKAVIVNDFNADRANETANLISELNKDTEAFAAVSDVTRWDSVQDMVQQAINKFGRIDILVNNAGNAGASTPEAMAKQKTFIETTPDEWDQWIGVNYFGPMYTCRAVLPSMVSNQYGKIVNIISDAGRVGEPKLVVYSGAKAGAAGFTRGLAKEISRYNITANCVALSTMNTPGVSSFTENEEILKKMLKKYPIKRIGEPEDAANAVLFLSSDASSWITGQTYPVNGGYSFNQ
ncbi:SDR family NAD(P)-dependent oxidoreductase [Peribacillus glennii]|uniref:SDR family oxidoreductase n=1 Tax=Peribacillus glennii TaxID=2303991 RepID=A0A372LF93_9BACI|nr:SDR family oxidoreductase [Peribacillus glennii]RFU64993.1 SDR family oxidoreductase [Peribacillus glennii]